MTEREDASLERPAFLSRLERFGSIPSTNDVVRSWLAAGTAEVCAAVAGEQTAGRGRSGRTWTAPPGAGLLLSLGFRPSYLVPDRFWRLGAIVALAMADAAEDSCGLRAGTIRLKWPNDLVVEAAAEGAGVRAVEAGSLRKLGGVLGEAEDAGTAYPRVVVGLGVNADWARTEFPAELAGSMTSLREVSGGRPVDRDALLEEFLLRLEARYLALQVGRFDVASWHERQVTTGRRVSLEGPGGAVHEALAVGVDGATGALMVQDAGGGEREILAGEVVHVRLAEPRAERGGVTR